MPLAPNDPVSECIGIMGHLLQLLPVNCLLTNGKIEKQLKFFLGAAWERGDPARRAYVMDKRPFGGFELDLLTFENEEPRFWIEAKASFKDDWNDVQGCAEKALNQATARIGSVACDGYIVHFLTSLPQPGGIRLPWYMWGVFERLREAQPSELGNRAQDLEVIYREGAQGIYDSSAAIRVWPVPNHLAPTVFAVVVKLGLQH